MGQIHPSGTESENNISSIEDAEEHNDQDNLLEENDVVNGETFCRYIFRIFLTFFCCKKTVRKRKRSVINESHLGNEPKIIKLDASTETDKVSVEHFEAQTDVEEAPSADEKPDTGCEPVDDYLDFPFLRDKTSIKDMSNSLTMIIMRGLAGSGKSTIVDEIRRVFPGAMVCSADNYFLQENGEYKFDFSRLKDAHEQSQSTAEDYCRKLTNVVVVDNTNVKRWEMVPYLKTAIKYRYTVFVVEPKTPWRFDPDVLAVRNCHGVPRQVLTQKVKTWQVVLPQYFGWFLNLADSQLLLDLAKTWLEKCLHIEEFRTSLATHTGQDQADLESLLSMFTRQGMSEGSRDRCHCTSRFITKEMKLAGDLPSVVAESLGKVSTLTIAGFFITPYTMGARVLLTEEQLELWGQNDEETWSPPVLTQKKLTNDSNSANSWLENDWMEMKNEAVSACRSSLVVGGGEGWADHDQVMGRRAHITIGCVEGVKPLQTGLDQLSLLSRMGEGQVVEGLYGGRLVRCGEQGWWISLNKKARVQAVFTGSY